MKTDKDVTYTKLQIDSVINNDSSKENGSKCNPKAHKNNIYFTEEFILEVQDGHYQEVH